MIEFRSPLNLAVIIPYVTLPGNCDVLLVAAFAPEPPIMGCVYRVVYHRNSFEHKIALDAHLYGDGG